MTQGERVQYSPAPIHGEAASELMAAQEETGALDFIVSTNVSRKTCGKKTEES